MSKLEELKLEQELIKLENKKIQAKIKEVKSW